MMQFGPAEAAFLLKTGKVNVCSEFLGNWGSLCPVAGAAGRVD
jgi:hypothetical protein